MVYLPSFRGHYECSKFGAPQHVSPGGVDKFQWQLPEILNHHWSLVASKIPSLNGRFFVLNTSASSVLRPDAHRANAGSGTSECLHFCTPGLPRSWIELLYNLLLKLRMEREARHFSRTLSGESKL